MTIRLLNDNLVHWSLMRNSWAWTYCSCTVLYFLYNGYASSGISWYLLETACTLFFYVKHYLLPVVDINFCEVPVGVIFKTQRIFAYWTLACGQLSVPNTLWYAIFYANSRNTCIKVTYDKFQMFESRNSLTKFTHVFVLVFFCYLHITIKLTFKTNGVPIHTQKIIIKFEILINYLL